MKKLLNKLFKKQQPVHKSIRGITEDQHCEIRRLICDEYNAARGRQTTSKVPSAYMKGLQKALDIVDSFEPTELN